MSNSREHQITKDQMVKASWMESFSIKLGSYRSEVLSFVSGVLIASTVNMLTSLVWSPSLERDLPWVLVSSSFICLAGVWTSILSWRMSDLQKIVDSKTRTRLYQNKTMEERWQFAICKDKDKTQRRRLIGLIRLLTFSCIFFILGIVTIILWIKVTHLTNFHPKLNPTNFQHHDKILPREQSPMGQTILPP